MFPLPAALAARPVGSTSFSQPSATIVNGGFSYEEYSLMVLDSKPDSKPGEQFRLGVGNLLSVGEEMYPKSPVTDFNHNKYFQEILIVSSQ